MSADIQMTQKALCHFRIYSGSSRAGCPARFMYVGVAEGLLYIAPFVDQCFFEHSSVEREGVLEWEQLEVFLEQNQTDMSLLMALSAVVQRFQQPGDIVGLSRIHQKVDVSAGWKYVLGELSHRESKRRTQSIKQGFNFDVSTKDEDFFSFYRSMHVPTMNARYGAFARSVQEQSAYQDLFKQGVLFRVHLNKEWIAGSVSQIDWAARTLNARLIGVKDGGALYRENGAQNFVYHAILEWASNQSSIDSVDFQGCEPFLSKGTFQYKKRFGAQAIVPANPFGLMRILIRVPTLSAAARQFLINNPFIGLDSDRQLQAQYFYDSDHEIRLDIPFASKGIYSQVSHNLDQWHD
ncbi:hypothetical protein [Pseudomonas putida]|uniref:hypothetical protein n=1 Tax=Pseudomonas putida TaxID=303 RepID=UPI003D962BA3